eukprot:COSAG04_NODE_28820_length_273_cov_0.597701_1_plen_24_part_01
MMMRGAGDGEVMFLVGGGKEAKVE